MSKESREEDGNGKPAVVIAEMTEDLVVIIGLGRVGRISSITASIYHFFLLTCCSIEPAIDPSGSLDWMDGVLDRPGLEDQTTAATATAAREADEFPSGSCDPRDTTDNKSEDVLETRGCSEMILAAIMVAGGKTWD